MRKGFVESLLKIMEMDKNVYMLTGDLGFSWFEAIAEKFGNRFINAGVAEQNMIGVASGLALSGKTVFVYSITPFIVFRPFEQIRLDLCSTKANVKLVGYGGGFTYGPLGVTHFAIEDISLMCSLPNMTVVCPSDRAQAGILTQKIYEYVGPVYMRIGGGYGPIYEGKYPEIEIGKGIILRDGNDITLVSNGNMLGETIKVADILEKNNYKTMVIDMHTVKPIDYDLVRTMSKMNAVFTIEEHSIIGGLGSAVSRIILENKHDIIFKKFGVKDKYIDFTGSHEHIRKMLGLDAENISQSILNIMKSDKK